MTAIAWSVTFGLVLHLAFAEPCNISLEQAWLQPVIARAQRPSTVFVELQVVAGATPCPWPLYVSLVLPSLPSLANITLNGNSSVQTCSWNTTLDTSVGVQGNATVQVSDSTGTSFFTASFPVSWSAPVPVTPMTYPPPPTPIDTSPFVLGMMTCPIWRGKEAWQPLEPFRSVREPALSWYDEGNPEVTDWEISWAVSHGVSFFMSVWYRRLENAGQAPIQPAYDHWLPSFFAARYSSYVRFAIEWDNANECCSGLGGGPSNTSAADDFLNNLLPFWTQTYFKHPQYYSVAGAPVVWIHGPDVFVSQLGGPQAAQSVMARAQAWVKGQGFGNGFLLAAQYCSGYTTNPHPEWSNIFNFTWGYHWPTLTQYSAGLPTAFPDPSVMTGLQPACWQDQSNIPLPDVITASAGWDDRPWDPHTPYKMWKAPADDFSTLLFVAKATLQGRQYIQNNSGVVPTAAQAMSATLLMLDNWNEWGEGHYMGPHRALGFSLLDALRSVFCNNCTDLDGADASGGHVDLVPEDVALGPYTSCWTGTNTTPCDDY